MTNELENALRATAGHKMSDAEQDAQRISFAYGNAPRDDKGTKEAVRMAARAEMAAA